MLQFGNGFKVTNPRKLLEREKEYLNLSSMKVVMIGSTYMWIWVAMEPESKHILAVTVSKERTMLIAERFILSLTNRYGIHPVSTEMVVRGIHHKPVGS
jgi:transposase-like protein